jgi:putative phosphoesterase
MKVGLISDIHANIYALSSTLKELEGMDLILCAGDITGYYPFVNEVFEELESYKVAFVKGNLDAYLCGDRINDLRPIEPKSFEYTRNHITSINLDKVRKAPLELQVTIDGFKLVMFHASPWNKLEEYVYPDYPDFEKFKEVDADIIILGHTHYPMVKQVGAKLIINPGSCGQPRDCDPRASFAVFDTLTKSAVIKRVQYDVERVCAAVRELGFDNRLIEILKRTKHES